MIDLFGKKREFVIQRIIGQRDEEVKTLHVFFLFLGEMQ